MTAPAASVAAVQKALDAWRESRQPGWYKDVGYQLQGVVSRHRYDLRQKGAKPDDPGWHPCSCGEWEGYWSGFEPHVADHLRAVAVAAADAAVQAATPGIQAGALRGAAEWIEHHDAKAATNVKSVRKWLRTNADRIEADHE